MEVLCRCCDAPSEIDGRKTCGCIQEGWHYGCKEHCALHCPFALPSTEPLPGGDPPLAGIADDDCTQYAIDPATGEVTITPTPGGDSTANGGRHAPS